MRRLESWILRCVVAISLAITLMAISCQRTERIAKPPETESPPFHASGEDGEGGELGVVLPDELVPDTVGTVQCSVVVWWGDGGESEGDDPESPPLPEPEEFIGWLRAAYEQRNPQMVAMILVDDFVCTEITPDGERSWDKDTEIRIHERMFDPNCEVKPIEDVRLELGNVTVIPPPGDPQDPAAVWTVRCDAHLVLDYVSAEDGVWEFLGPAEFLIRANPESPCGWELVAWHDQLPYD